MFRDWRMLVIGVVSTLAVCAGMFGAYHLGTVQQQSSDTCPVASTASVEQVFGGVPLTVLYNDSTCVFTNGSYATVTVKWMPDPQGKLFAENRRAVMTPLFSLKGAARATTLAKISGVYFDSRGRLYVVTTYYYPMSFVKDVARAVIVQQ